MYVQYVPRVQLIHLVMILQDLVHLVVLISVE